MKKLVLTCLIAVLALTMSLSAFAANGDFLQSPSTNQAPTVDKAENGDGGAVTVTVTPYADRADLDAGAKAEIEDAYDSVAGTTDITTVCSALTAIATTAGVKAADLAVSDFFDLSTNATGEITVTLAADTLDKFVALIHWNGTAWEVVEGATVKSGKLTFTADDFSPFAIVVDGSKDAPSPTGDNATIIICGVVALVSAVAVVVFVKKSKKTVA